MCKGFEPYRPRYLKRRSHARKIDQMVPMFPRYLFVRIDWRRCAYPRGPLPRVSDYSMGWLIEIGSRSCLTCWDERFGSRSRPARLSAA
ncbi:hypothetical protein [Bradyrhizobium zhanjiangense]|uniref:hypothetical protein n=1 Tax=Bradyrhizobium zhanjiangense TaxID=1325107 RepID=UPI0030840BDF